MGEHPGGDLAPDRVVIRVCHQVTAQLEQLGVVVRVPFERVHVLFGPGGIAEHGADPAASVLCLGVERVDFEGTVQAFERVPGFSAGDVDFGPALERARITPVDLERPVQPAGGGVEIAQREVIAPAPASTAESDWWRAR